MEESLFRLSIMNKRNRSSNRLLSSETQRQSPFKREPSPRGVLALIVGPLNARCNGNDFGSTHKMTYFKSDPTFPRLTNRKRERNDRFGDDTQFDVDEENPSAEIDHQSPLGEGWKRSDLPNMRNVSSVYHPLKSEFTLLYFYESHVICRNSKRFSLVLASFMNEILQSSMKSCVRDPDQDIHAMKCPIQLICVPNCKDSLGNVGAQQQRYQLLRGHTPARTPNPTILSHLIAHTSLWHMGFDHANRLAIIRILSVSVVPSLIIVNNETGEIITTWGMEAIEEWAQQKDGGREKGTRHSDFLLSKWRHGHSGVSICSRFLGACLIS